MDLQKAYEMVFNDMTKKGPNLFQGNYDSKNGNKDFMYGILTVMEFISYVAGVEDFDNVFIKNMIKSEERA